jgi:hypothetical protein
MAIAPLFSPFFRRPRKSFPIISMTTFCLYELDEASSAKPDD